MKKLFLSAALLLALPSLCSASPKLPKRPGYSAAPIAIQREPDYTGRLAMLVDGNRVGKLERQASGTYLLRYADGSAVRCSINEVVLMPEVK